MRLLCDEMLARLGRWLRAAGYDTEIATGGASDRALTAHCAGDGPLRVCPNCGRLYWPGGYIRRMLGRLSSFNT